MSPKVGHAADTLAVGDVKPLSPTACTVTIDDRSYHVGARTAAMLERIARRADKIEGIQIGEIHVKFHDDRVRSLLITESDDPRV